MIEEKKHLLDQLKDLARKYDRRESENANAVRKIISKLEKKSKK